MTLSRLQPGYYSFFFFFLTQQDWSLFNGHKQRTGSIIRGLEALLVLFISFISMVILVFLFSQYYCYKHQLEMVCFSGWFGMQLSQFTLVPESINSWALQTVFKAFEQNRINMRGSQIQKKNKERKRWKPPTTKQHAWGHKYPTRQTFLGVSINILFVP